jgi:hypothetical protein
MRKIGCEDCEAQVQHLTRSRSLSVREREALWRAIHMESAASACPMECSTRSLIARVSANLAGFVEKLARQEQLPPAKPSGSGVVCVGRGLALREP